VPEQSDYGDAAIDRAFDFNKHVATLALISIGGVLGLLQGSEQAISPRAAMLVMACLGTAAFIALITNSSLVGGALKSRGAPSAKVLIASQWLSVGLLLFGAGMFVGAFSKSVT
jgi:hypothetical protein